MFASIRESNLEKVFLGGKKRWGCACTMEKLAAFDLWDRDFLQDSFLYKDFALDLFTVKVCDFHKIFSLECLVT